MITAMHLPAVDNDTYVVLQEIMADEFNELITLFRQDTALALQQLTLCLEEKNSEQVGIICHKLKSSSKLIGAFNLAEFACLLEKYKDDKNQRQAWVNLLNLQAEYNAVIAWLDNNQMLSV